ncbi:hypothetical protein [Spirosoma litoris]
MNTDKQSRHKTLLGWADQFPQYKGYENRPSFFSETLTRDNLNPKFLKITDINPAVVIFTDALNLPAGSFSDVDLYQLMQAYLTDPVKRQQINQIVKP